ncbi:MAG: sugar ABC transporter permease [Defluviitaleaceae bacterium]|nr:sugar ABC transporter permease [Defluviitaleaceae bacterium]
MEESIKKPKRKKVSNNILSPKMQNRLGLLFLLPWLIGFIVFTGVPFFASIYLSFFRVEQTILGFETTYTGWGNYFTILFQHLEFNPAMIEYIVMIFTYTPTIIVMSFILAYFLNMKLRGRLFFRTIYFLPVIVLSGPVMFEVMDAGATGGEIELMNIFIFRMVYYYVPIAGEALLVLFSNFSIILWFTGIPIVLFITAIQKINPSLYEAARIDSASTWQILFKITLPLVKQTILISTIFTIAQLGIFATNPLSELIHESMHTSGGLGQASAMAWLYSIVTLLIIGLCALLLRQKKA